MPNSGIKDVVPSAREGAMYCIYVKTTYLLLLTTFSVSIWETLNFLVRIILVSLLKESELQFICNPERLRHRLLLKADLNRTPPSFVLVVIS
jgi:hypothetical protein